MSATLSVSPCPAIPSTCTSTRAPAAGRLETPRRHERIVSSGEIRRPDRQAENEVAHPARQWLHAPDAEPGRTHLHHCFLAVGHRRPGNFHLFLRPVRTRDRRQAARRRFANSAKIFAAPESVSVGDAITPDVIATDLRRSGYTESPGNPVGYYKIHSNYIEIFPQSDSYFDQEPGLIRFARGRISQIVSLQDNTAAISTNSSRSSSRRFPGRRAKSGAW